MNQEIECLSIIVRYMNGTYEIDYIHEYHESIFINFRAPYFTKNVVYMCFNMNKTNPIIIKS